MAAVLVHIDLDGDRPHASSWLALAAGRHVASSWGATLYASLIAQGAGEKRSPDSTAQVVSAATVPGIEQIEDALARGGADKVVVAMIDAPVAPLWATVGTAWQAVVDHLRPRLVLFGANAPSAAELAPRTAARLGARLLMRARAIASTRGGSDDVELRDRDGGYARISDGGATVALIGRAEPVRVSEEDIDLIVLAIPGSGDPCVEPAGSAPAETAHATGGAYVGGVIVALGDDVARDPAVARDARRLASLLGAHLLDSAGTTTAAPPTPLAPELCVLIGKPHVDVAGATSVIRIGAPASKSVDGALAGDVAKGLAELIARLERP